MCRPACVGSRAGGTVAITDPPVPNGGSVELRVSDITSGAHPTLAYSENNTAPSLGVTEGRYAAALALLGNYMAGTFATRAGGQRPRLSSTVTVDPSASQVTSGRRLGSLQGASVGIGGGRATGPVSSLSQPTWRPAKSASRSARTLLSSTWRDTSRKPPSNSKPLTRIAHIQTFWSSSTMRAAKGLPIFGWHWRVSKRRMDGRYFLS
jgi:hypothetical protein